MKFIVIGYDGTDEKALERRMAVRGDHLALVNEGIAQGKQLLGAALLNDDNNMAGSVMLFDFPTREALDAWLEKEPYIKGNVWRRVEVHPCQIPSSFDHMFKS